MQRKSFLGRAALGTFHEVVYWQWGPSDGPVLLCVHGLTRNGRDFDAVAERFSDRWRVVCPDIVGRGDSGRLADPLQYGYPQYLADLTALIARLDVDRVAWLGTSMGALLGMIMAAGPGTPVDRLLMNDAGPVVTKDSLQRIAAYLGAAPEFVDLAAAEAYIRQVHAPFGPLTDDQWMHLARHSVSRRDDGRYALKYDPAIAVPFQGAVDEDLVLWPVWDAIQCPVTVIRGAQSDLLRPDTLAEMQARGPKTTAHEIPGVGHAPALMSAAQLDLVAAWLDA
ncbi:MAG: alpha/beta hydrolase [Rhodospirillaceae bacterium]|nr:alpha/beta hydrolase [Magnetovibrio sp.]MAY66982.1 alpha/beta hydrolase [Rhodospirillaceae bacterium]